MSPGRALTRRHEAERQLQAQLGTDLDVLLHGTLLDASSALDAPVLLAAGGARPAEPFTLAVVLGRWGTVVTGLTRRLASFLHTPDDPYLALAAARLSRSELPSAVYDTVVWTLKTSLERGWAPPATRAELARALRSDTPSLIPATAGLEQTGPAWSALADRIARTEATAVAGHFEMGSLVAAGHLDKRWVARHDKLTRPDHLRADGQTVPVTAAFSVGGYNLMYPGDPSGPTLMTVNCRCVIVGIN